MALLIPEPFLLNERAPKLLKFKVLWERVCIQARRGNPVKKEHFVETLNALKESCRLDFSITESDKFYKVALPEFGYVIPLRRTLFREG